MLSKSQSDHIMRSFNLILFILVCSFPLFSQQKAVTETGEQVVLYNDGRWTYVNKDTIREAEIPVNPRKFEKDTDASFLVKSTKMNIGFWLDPKAWSFVKSESHDAAEFEFVNEEKGLYGLSITETLELPMEALANIALDNARDAAPDVKVVSKEYRTVNGLKVLMMQMTGTIQEILFSYYGYYYTSGNGALQFLVYSSKENVDAHAVEIEKLLNGLVEVKE
jgi:hypothetical protein